MVTKFALVCKISSALSLLTILLRCLLPWRRQAGTPVFDYGEHRLTQLQNQSDADHHRCPLGPAVAENKRCKASGHCS